MHPERGAAGRAGDRDYFAAFARYETALDFSRKTAGAEEPLVLVRQRECINEPSPGKFVWEKNERNTKWQVPWLKVTKRGPNRIPEFLAAHGVAEQVPK